MVKSWNAWKISHVTWTWPKFPPRLPFFGSKKMFKTTVAGSLDDSRGFGILHVWYIVPTCGWFMLGKCWCAYSRTMVRIRGYSVGFFLNIFSLGILSNRRTTPAKVRFPRLKQPHFWGSNYTYYILIDLNKNTDKKQSKLYSLEYHPIL